MTEHDKLDRRRGKFSRVHNKVVSRTLRYTSHAPLQFDPSTGSVAHREDIVVVSDERLLAYANVRRQLALALRAFKKRHGIESTVTAVLSKSISSIESLRYCIAMNHAHETGDVLLSFVYTDKTVACVCLLTERDRQRLLEQLLTAEALDEFIAVHAAITPMSEARARYNGNGCAPGKYQKHCCRSKRDYDRHDVRRELREETHETLADALCTQ